MSKLVIKTDKLKEMVSRAVKGASNNKLLPITELMCIEVKNNKLTLLTTDYTNYLYITEKVENEDFYVVTRVDQFSKLIGKMTSENVTLEIVDDKLCITGNGKYSIELPIDVDGEMVKYPNPMSEIVLDDNESKILNLTTAKLILTVNKAALATSMEVPCYTGYYTADKVVTTDTYKICSTNINVLDTATLISPEMMNLMDTMISEKIEVYRKDNNLICVSPDCCIFGAVLEGIEDFAIEAITSLVEQEFNSMCKIPKSAILGVLERINLFVGTYDNSEIYMTFTTDGLMCSSKSSSGTEVIPYADSKDFTYFTCAIDINMLISQIKANASDMIELWYGADNAIKITDGNVTQVIALAEDDRVSAE